jgi:hypothetical protein
MYNFAPIQDFPGIQGRPGTARDRPGSFDKGIYLRFPLQLLGPETSARAAAVVRPVVRDGGQRLAVDNPLWEVTRDGRLDALGRGYGGFLR